MTLTAMCPKDWVTVSNSLEKRYESYKDASNVLERHDIESMPAFFGKDDCAVYEFE
jgi:hypothetical protein